MPLRLIEATEEHRPLLERMLQLYLHDLSEFADTEPDKFGVYCKDHALSEEGRGDLCSFLILLRGKPAGFACFRPVRSHSSEPARLLEDYFVLRSYRRLGIGEEAARMLFDQIPGRWEIEIPDQNDVARSFWRQVMRRYTLRRFRELRSPSNKGIVFEFTSPPSDPIA